MKAVIFCLCLVALVAAVEKPKVRPVILNPKENFGLMKVITVPKGDVRARGPAAAGCPACKCDCNKQTQNPTFPTAPKLQTGAAACKDNSGRAGTCIDAASCKGTTVSGKCAGASNIKCCIPAASTPAPAPVTPTPTAPAAACAYASAPSETVAGNNNVKYTATLIRREHMVDPSKYGIDMVQADNRIVINTGTACAFEKMAADAAAAGVSLKIASGFRTLARQQYFYNCMITKKCNNGNLAAKPGTSNHGQGLALDLNTDCGSQGTAKAPLPRAPAACKSSKVYVWLLNNASKYGFVRAVQNEPWHWEYRVGRASPAWQKF